MGGIAQQEDAPLAEAVGDAMMDAVGREPVHRANFHFHMLDGAGAHILESQGLRMRGAVAAHGPDQSRPALAFQRKHRQEVGLVQIDMQFAIKRRAGGVDVSDVEQLLVGAARESRPDALPNDRPRTIATGEIGALARLLLAVRSAQGCADHRLVLH